MKTYIKNFYIRNTKTGQRVKELKDGDSFYKEDYPDCNIEVVGLWTEEVPVAPDKEGSVRIKLNNTEVLEQNNPYCFFGDQTPIDWQLGSYSLSASAFTDDAGTQNPSIEGKINFTVKTKNIASDLLDPSIYINGSIIYAERGKVYDFLGKQIDLNGKTNIIIKSLPGHGTPAIIKYNKRHEYKSPYWINRSSNIIFEDVLFDVGEDNTVVVSDATNVKFINCKTQNGGLFKAHLGGVDGLTVENLEVLTPFYGNIGYSGGSSKANKNFTITNSKCLYQSQNEHIFRFHNLEGLLVEGCTLDNSKAPEGGHPLNLRDGKDFVIKNNKITGPIVVGPLEIAGNESKSLVNVTFENNEINGYIFIYSGVSNFSFNNTKGKSYSSGYVFNVKKPWGSRTDATGKIQNSNMYYITDKGQFINYVKPTKVKLVNNMFQGKPYPDN